MAFRSRVLCFQRARFWLEACDTSGCFLEIGLLNFEAAWSFLWAWLKIALISAAEDQTFPRRRSEWVVELAPPGLLRPEKGRCLLIAVAAERGSACRVALRVMSCTQSPFPETAAAAATAGITFRNRSVLSAGSKWNKERLFFLVYTTGAYLRGPTSKGSQPVLQILRTAGRASLRFESQRERRCLCGKTV